MSFVKPVPLNSDEQSILLALALAGRSLLVNELKALLKDLGWAVQGKNQSLATLVDKAWCQRMLEFGTISEPNPESSSRIIIDFELAAVLQRRVDQATYREIVRVLSESPTAMQAHSFETARMHALYAGDAQRFFGLSQLMPYRQLWDEGLGQVLAYAVVKFEPEWFETLPPAMQWQIQAYAVTLALTEQWDIRPLMASLAACASRDDSHSPAFDALWRAARVLLGEEVAVDPQEVQNSSWLGCTAGFVALNEDKCSEAVQFFEHALKLRRKELNIRNASLDPVFLTFYMMALLRLGDQESLQKIQKWQTRYERSIFSAERMLIASAASRRAMVHNRHLDLGEEATDAGAIAVLIQCCYDKWFESTSSTECVNSLRLFRNWAHNHGLAWFGSQADAVLGVSTVEANTNLKIASLIASIPEWQMSLKALANVAAPKEQRRAGDDSQTRLVWFLDDDFQLEPREQKLNKSGAWSKGRKVALKRLLDPRSGLPVTAADEQLCECIRAFPDYSYGSYRETTTYELSEDAIFQAVGHPAIFWPNELGEPVDVREGSPELIVREQGDRLHLSLSPKATYLDDDYVITRLGFSQIEVTKFSHQHQEINRILGTDGLTVPMSAREQVLQSISAIAPLLTVQSDIASDTDQEAELVDCDPHLHVQIQPAGEGLRIAALIRPFGEQGPLFVPGSGGQNVISEIEGKRLRSQRDLAREAQLLAQLVDSAPVFQIDTGNDWLLEDPVMALEGLDALRNYSEPLILSWPRGRSMSLLGQKSVGSMQVNVSSQREWFGLDGDLVLDEDNVMSLQRVLQLVRQSNGRFLKIGESEFLALSAGLHKKLQSISALTDDDGFFHPLASSAIAELTDGMVATSSVAWEQKQQNLQEARELKLELPQTLDAQLRDYQQLGFDWMMRLAHWGGGACLADDMGLGKTVQILAVLLARAHKGPALVLAPTSVCMNWLNEAARFAPTLRVQRFGTGDRAAQLADLGARDVLVCSYGLMQSEHKLLQPQHWHTLVADEAQALKNPKALRSRAAVALNADFRIAATGTPIENHLGELWSLFQLINPGLLGSQKQFEQQSIGPIDRGDEHAKLRLRALVAPFILRRHKSQVLTELPSRTEINRVIEPTEEEKTFYEALRRQALDDLNEATSEGPNVRFKVLAEIMRLRRACCNPRLVLPEVDVASGKLRELLLIVDELRENGHRALIFSQFVDHLGLIRAALQAQQISFQYLDGSTSIKNRQKAVDDFQNGEGDVFLISLKAGGSGLNLTAADYVIHMDPWWNPAVEDQASDRAHRMGQQRPVTIYRLIMAGTIEEKILSLHGQKRELADSLLEGRDVATSVDLQDMLALLHTD